MSQREERAPIEGKAFRSALGSFATGVTIVTTCDRDGHDVGLTANSFNSVSLDPPLVLWSLAKTSLSFAAFETASHFAVHILASDQQALSDRFARRGEDKFANLKIERGEGEIPLLIGCAARFRCRPAYRYDGGDHVILVGEVIGFDHSSRAPLMFHEGRYATAPQPVPPVEGADDLGHLLQRAYFHLLTPVRAERARLGLSLHDHYVLSVLAASDGITVEQVNAIIDYTGVRASEAQADALAARGLVRIAAQTRTLALTRPGRDAIAGLVGAAKAVEADVARHMSADQQHQLKNLLRLLLKIAEPGMNQSVLRHMDLLEQVNQATTAASA
ncbi:flavin reductase [Sphingomonas sp. 1P06PA]|uniref:flavin reductase n=1 Tax=Sphingomonas sp. 1P06PA TaxID=554121 RepID=UPI0039A42781